MRILFISQVFWPDTSSVAQHLWDLAEALEKKGHSVNAYSSRYPYEDKTTQYPTSEKHNRVVIERINHTGFGKSSVLGRLADFLSFNVLIFFKLLFLPRKKYDLIIGTTVPPFLSFIGVIIAKWKEIPFYYWVMDMQPELAIASGMIKPNSLSAKLFTWIGNYTIKKSTLIFALDKYMKTCLINRGAKAQNVHVLPIWPIIDSVYEGERIKNPFRVEHGFGDKIVVMYSGNHAYVHPLDTLLEAALKLKDDNQFLFVFIGGGVRKKDVTEFKIKHDLNNIVQLPYQPRNMIHFSLGSADLQVVIMGNSQVGFTHPNKIYGALYLGKPVVYIGPSPSHITDILGQLPGNINVNHGNIDDLVKNLKEFAILSDQHIENIKSRNQDYTLANYSPKVLKDTFIDVIEKHIQSSNSTLSRHLINSNV